MVSLGDVWGGFTGDTAKKYANEAYANSTRELQAGRDQSVGALNTGYDRAASALQPYQQQGAQANTLWGQFMGLGGHDAQKQAFADYQSSPYQQYQQNQITRAMGRQANAGGYYNSGRADYATSRALADRGAQDYDSYMNRLQAGGQQGYGAANTLGGYAMGNGQNLANIYTGYGQQQAGNEIQRSNALAQASNTFGNNLLKLGGLAVSAYTGMPVGMGGAPGGKGTGGNFGGMNFMGGQ